MITKIKFVPGDVLENLGYMDRINDALKPLGLQLGFGLDAANGDPILFIMTENAELDHLTQPLYYITSLQNN